LEGLGEFDGGHSFLNGGVVTADQVGVRWDSSVVVATLVQMHNSQIKCICYVGQVNIHPMVSEEL